jgi:release factor glutamine methyltransferase
VSKYPLLKYIGEVYRPSEDSWLLVSLLSERKPSGNICLDLGSGSGIIGLYALLNGFCDRVVFVDIDEDAVKSTLSQKPFSRA